MGLINPTTLDVDMDEFRALPAREQIRQSVQHWGTDGFGTPTYILVVYILKFLGYAVGGAAIIAATTPELGPLTEFRAWWTEPIVLQKAVLWTLLFEVAGLGCGFGPLTLHFFPPYTAPFHWLRPGTTRLAPWPKSVPFTAGHTRSIVDVLLYVGVVASAWYALSADGDPALAVEGYQAHLIGPGTVVPLLILLPLIGLRDKVIFLAARSEQYLVMTALFLFPFTDMLVGSKWVLVAIWWGAATSKLNQHFPFVVSTMITNAPGRPKAFKRALWTDYPSDMRPSRLAFYVAHVGTVVEFGVPLMMILGGGGILTQVGIVIMVVFHLHILSALPLGVPLEWNIFFPFATLFLFGAHGDVSMFSGSPLLYFFLVATIVAMPVLGNMRPDLVSFLPAMRYYAGNWATSVWLFSPEGERKFHERLKKVSPSSRDQLAVFYDEDTVDLLLLKGFAFRQLHTHGRALAGLIPRMVEDPADYERIEGEVVAGLALGWNFGDGHLHDQTLIEALQAQCDFAPGEVRVATLEAQPFGDPRQQYRLHDAADGEFERGIVSVADMCEQQPWLDDPDGTFPVQVTSSRIPRGGAPRGRQAAPTLPETPAPDGR